MSYREHPSKAVRFEQGKLVPYPPADAEDCTVWFPLDDAGSDEWEGILGRRVGDGRIELVGIPVFVYGVNLGDEVTVTKSAEGADIATAVVRDACNYTFRVWFELEPAHPGEHWRLLMHDLATAECWFDTWSEKLVAISAAPASAQNVADYLSEREGSDELRYETGRIELHS